MRWGFLKVPELEHGCRSELVHAEIVCHTMTTSRISHWLESKVESNHEEDGKIHSDDLCHRWMSVDHHWCRIYSTIDCSRVSNEWCSDEGHRWIHRRRLQSIYWIGEENQQRWSASLNYRKDCPPRRVCFRFSSFGETGSAPDEYWIKPSDTVQEDEKGNRELIERSTDLDQSYETRAQLRPGNDHSLECWYWYSS